MKSQTERILGFALVSTVPAAFVWFCTRALEEMSLTKDYSYIPLIPVVTFYLIYLRRKRIFCETSPGWKLGSLLLIGGLACFAIGQLNLLGLGRENIFSVEMLGAGLAWTGAFSFFFGSNALEGGAFSFLVSIFYDPRTRTFPQPNDLSTTRGQCDSQCISVQHLRSPFSTAGI